MKHLTINAKDFKVSDLSPFHFGWCNRCAKKDLEKMRRQSNLEIVEEHENPAYEYHYFFDLRDCNDTDYRPQGETAAEKLDFYSREISDIQGRIYDIKEYELNTDFVGMQEKVEKLERIYNRLDSIQEELWEIAQTLK